MADIPTPTDDLTLINQYTMQIEIMGEYKRQKDQMLQLVKEIDKEQKLEVDFRQKAKSHKTSVAQIGVVVGFGTGIVVLLLLLLGVI